jgi:hypothetical protein
MLAGMFSFSFGKYSFNLDVIIAYSTNSELPQSEKDSMRLLFFGKLITPLPIRYHNPLEKGHIHSLTGGIFYLFR